MSKSDSFQGGVRQYGLGIEKLVGQTKWVDKTYSSILDGVRLAALDGVASKTPDALLGYNREWDAISRLAKAVGVGEQASIRALNDAMVPNVFAFESQVAKTMCGVAEQTHFAVTCGALSKALDFESQLTRTMFGVAAEHVQRMTKLYEPMFTASSKIAAIDAFRAVDDRFGVGRIFDNLYRGRLEDAALGRVMAATMGAATLASIPWKDPIGILSPLLDSEDFALTWADPDEPPKLSAAALRRQAQELPKLVIELKLKCHLCDSAIVTMATEFGWEGDNNGILEASLIPACPTCTRRAMQDPDYLANALDQLMRPKLRVIQTGGESDGVRKGNLRLVTEEPETEAD